MLDDKIKRMATEGRNIAAVTTMLPDGTPMTQPVWIDADDDHLLFNTEVERQKYRNLSRDPRATIVIIDSENPYIYAEVRGEMVDSVSGPEARAHIDQLSQKYTRRSVASWRTPCATR